MLEFCEVEGITLDDLRLRSQAAVVVARRRRCAVLCHAAGIGRVIIGNLLELDGSTVAAYLDPGIIRRKVERRQRRRLAQKSVADDGISVPIVVP